MTPAAKKKNALSFKQFQYELTSGVLYGQLRAGSIMC